MLIPTRTARRKFLKELQLDLLKKRIRKRQQLENLPRPLNPEIEFECPDTVLGAEPTLCAVSENGIETEGTATETKIFVSCKDCTDKMKAEYDE
jgi:hypothetical protein